MLHTWPQDGHRNRYPLQFLWIYQHSKSPFLPVTWILNWSLWILVVYIPTHNLLIILLSIYHSSRCKLKVYIILNNFHQKETIYDKPIFFCKIGKSKEWAKFELNYLPLIHYLFISIQNSKSLIKCRYWMPIYQDSYQGEIIQNFQHYICLFALLISKIFKTEWSLWVLLELTYLDETIRYTLKWFMLTWKCKIWCWLI